MKTNSVKVWILACAASALAAGALGAAPNVTIVKKLGADEALGRQMRVPYGSFENRLLEQRVRSLAKQEAAKLGITKLMIMTPVQVPGRSGSSATMTTLPESGTFSAPSAIGYARGELIAREVVKRTAPPQ